MRRTRLTAGCWQEPAVEVGHAASQSIHTIGVPSLMPAAVSTFRVKSSRLPTIAPVTSICTGVLRREHVWDVSGI